MSTHLAARFSFLPMLLLVAALVAGCKTTPAIDWNSRIGNYTYDQAVTDLGPPDKQTKLSDGHTVAEWITMHGSRTSFGIGTGLYGDGAGVGVGQSVGPSYSDHVLKLTFDADHQLLRWSKNYY